MEQEFSIEGMEDREWLRVEESEDHESIHITVDLGDALASICLDVYAWNALMKLAGKVNIHVPREGGE